MRVNATEISPPDRLRRILVFTAISFFISWTVAGYGWKAGHLNQPGTFIACAFAFMWGPAISAIICATLFDRSRVRQVLGITPKFNIGLFWAWIIPIALTVLATVFTITLSDVTLVSIEIGMAREATEMGLSMEDAKFPPGGLIMLPIAILTIGSLTNTILLISEELGWRGYLWALLIDLGFIKTSLITGTIWGIWHAPLIIAGYNYPGQPILGPILMIALCILISFPIGWARQKNGSVWAAALFHGTFNSVAPISLLFISSSNMPWRGVMGVGGFLAFAIAMIICIFVNKTKTYGPNS